MKSLKIAIALLVWAVGGVPVYGQGMFGLGKFKIEQSDDRFSTSGLTTFSGANNRISKKSVAGGIHIDGHGMFVDPLVVRRKADDSIAGLSLLVHNETEHDTAYGSPNSIGTPQRIAFLLSDGSPPIELEIVRGDSKFGDRIAYNSVLRSASSQITESGFAELTVEQFTRIAHASGMAVKIDGSERSVIYEVKDISKSFIPNLLSFYNSCIDKSKR